MGAGGGFNSTGSFLAGLNLPLRSKSDALAGGRDDGGGNGTSSVDGSIESIGISRAVGSMDLKKAYRCVESSAQQLRDR